MVHSKSFLDILSSATDNMFTDWWLFSNYIILMLGLKLFNSKMKKNSTFMDWSRLAANINFMLQCALRHFYDTQCSLSLHSTSQSLLSVWPRACHCRSGVTPLSLTRLALSLELEPSTITLLFLTVPSLLDLSLGERRFFRHGNFYTEQNTRQWTQIE